MAGKLITALNAMPDTSKHDGNMLAATISNSDGTTNKISVADIINTRFPDIDSVGTNLLLGTPPSTSDRKFSTVAIGTGLSLSGAVLETKIAGTSTLGSVRAASSSPITINSTGYLSIAQDKLNHAQIGGVISDEHINHGNVSLYAGSHIYINNGASNTLKTNSTIAVRTVSSPTASRIPETDTTGYLERFVRETIYIKVIPETEPVEGGKKGQFFIPTSLLGKKIISIGLGSYSTSSSGSTINVIFRKTGGSTLVTGTLPPSSDYNETTVVGTIPASGGKAEFYISTGNTNVKGLDAWITVIK